MLGETIKKMRLEQGLSCYELANVPDTRFHLFME